jgi:hypothetical protein
MAKKTAAASAITRHAASGTQELLPSSMLNDRV